MPVLKELEDGWIIDAEHYATPHLRDPTGCRYTLKRDAEGVLQFYTSRTQLPFARIVDLMKAYDDWETGKPQETLPEGWTWRIKKVATGDDFETSWCASKGGMECYLDVWGQLEASGIPLEVADIVLKVYKIRDVSKISQIPENLQPDTQSRHRAIKEGVI